MNFYDTLNLKIMQTHRKLQKSYIQFPVTFPQLSPVVTSHITVVKYQTWKQNWHNHINLTIGLIQFSPLFMLSCIFCMVLCNLIPCIDSCNHHQKQGTKLFHHRKEKSSCSPLILALRDSSTLVSLHLHSFISCKRQQHDDLETRAAVYSNSLFCLHC